MTMRIGFDCKDLDGIPYYLGRDDEGFVCRQTGTGFIRVGGVASGDALPASIRELVFRIPRAVRDSSLAGKDDPDFASGLTVLCGRWVRPVELGGEGLGLSVPVAFRAYLCGTGDMLVGFRGGPAHSSPLVREYRLQIGESPFVEVLLGEWIRLMDSMSGDFLSFRRSAVVSESP